jgi:large subunit ribosomal protein L17
MLANMASSLIESKRISTTLAKAKALRTYVEPLITKAKDDTTHSRRVVFSHLQNKNAVSELFRDVAVKVADRPGGYTRILRTGNRLGDNAEMCIIELVDYNEAMLTSTEEAAKPKRRRSRRGGKKEEAPVAEAAKQAKPVAEKESATAEAEEVKAVEDVQPIEETEEKAEAEVKSEAPAEAEAEEKPADEASEEDKKKEE